MDEELDWVALELDVEVEMAKTEIGSVVGHMLQVHHWTVVQQAIEEVMEQLQIAIDESQE